MIKDIFGTEAKVGDVVAYSRGGTGASEWNKGKVIKILGKSVLLGDHGETHWGGEEKLIKRQSGAFVIDINARLDGLVGKANAWTSLQNHVEESVRGAPKALKDEISAELFKDGCHSAWVHMAYFIDALAVKYEESEDEGY